MNFITQLALPIVLIALTYVATRAVERARWKREYAVRWDTTRLEAIASYASATKRMLTLSWDISKSSGLGTSVSPHTLAEAGHLLDEAETARGERFERVLLLASHQTVQLARQWHGFAWEFARIAKGSTAVTNQEFMSLRAECFLARDQFYASARSDLDVDHKKFRVDMNSLKFFPTLEDGEQ